MTTLFTVPYLSSSVGESCISETNKKKKHYDFKAGLQITHQLTVSLTSAEGALFIVKLLKKRTDAAYLL